MTPARAGTVEAPRLLRPPGPVGRPGARRLVVLGEEQQGHTSHGCSRYAAHSSSASRVSAWTGVSADGVVPHVYLSAMAILPRRRGLGAGTAMLRHGLDRASGLDLPAYLEASTPRNRRLYARHGFRDRGEPIHLPEGGPVLQPMWHDGESVTTGGGASA